MSYDTEHLMQHVEVAKAMFKERSSLLCKHKSGKVSLVGSFPYEDESGNCFLLRPGQRVNLEYIRTLGMIPSSKQYKDVTSTWRQEQLITSCECNCSLKKRWPSGRYGHQGEGRCC
jgi:hypothetical protein